MFAEKSFEHARSAFPPPSVQEEVRPALFFPAEMNEVLMDQPVPWHVYPQGIVALGCLWDREIIVWWISGCSAVRATFYNNFVCAQQSHRFCVAPWSACSQTPAGPLDEACVHRVQHRG